EVVRHYDDMGVREAVQTVCRAVLSAFDVEVIAVELLHTGTIPKTTSGKIQRRACRQSFLKGELKAVYRWKRAEGSHPLLTQQERKDETGVGQQPRTAPTVSRFGRQGFTPKVQEIVDWLVTHIAQRTQLDPRAVDIQTPLVH